MKIPTFQLDRQVQKDSKPRGVYNKSTLVSGTALVVDLDQRAFGAFAAAAKEGVGDLEVGGQRQTQDLPLMSLSSLTAS